MQQNQNVDGDLYEAADPELFRSVLYNVVDGLQQIAGQPEQDHGAIHADRGSVLVVPVQLRHAQAGLDQQRQQTDALHEVPVLDKQVHRYAGDQRDGRRALEVGDEVGPLPEVFGL